MRFYSALFVGIGLIVSTAVSAQSGPERELGNVALHQALLDVGTDLSLMCVATHPDDEDGATLTYFRKKYGYKTYALLATRGEGGQNEIGSELYEELGVIRTDEMARASEHTGAELHFLDYAEYGYSKNAEEAYAFWGQEETLRRMVRKIRELRPDVIITNHGERGGHGQHQAVGRTLMIAFDAAADPEVFPEQIDEGLEPWQAARLYLRSFRGRGAGSVSIPFGELDPVRGLTYAQIAANALREHETQGMGFFIDRFLTTRSSSSYSLMKEAKGGTQGGGNIDAPSGELFAGLKDRVSQEARDLSEKGTAGATKEAAFSLLAKAEGNEQSRLNTLAVAMSELRLRTKISDTLVTPGQNVTIDIEAADYGISDVKEVRVGVRQIKNGKMHSVQFEDNPVRSRITTRATPKDFVTMKFKVTIPTDLEPTIPHADNLFKPNFLKPQFAVVASVTTEHGPVTLESEILVDVAPKVSIEYLNAPYLVQQGDGEATFSLLVINNTPGAREVTLDLSASRGIELAEKQITVSFDEEDGQRLITLPAKFNSDLSPDDYFISAKVADTGYEARGIARVVDVVIPKNKNVGVIYSYDNTFMDTLERMGVSHEALQEDDFTSDKLDEFSTIIVDIRAYLVRPDLIANNQTLLNYVERGGTMLVMYQKTFEWKSKYAPYDLQLGRNRVTVEEAPITLLQPNHPLFTTPNTMKDSDWDGWRQERGLYFPSKWADEYTPLIDVKDPGENPPPGSLLITHYGQGTYLYTALGWYRQLRDLHPGTLRIFANMLAL